MLNSFDVWGHLDHQGSVYSASFASVPHLVDIAARIEPNSAERIHMLILVGTIAGDGEVSISSPQSEGPRYIEAAVIALRSASLLITESLLTTPEVTTAKWLLAALAAIAGFPRLWFEMQSLCDTIECPACGALFERE